MCTPAEYAYMVLNRLLLFSALRRPDKNSVLSVLSLIISIYLIALDKC